MTIRVFFALWPDADVAARLHAIALQRHAVLGGRVMREDSLHATLVFIGDVSPQCLPALQSAAAETQAHEFSMTLDESGCWRHNHIAYLGMRQIPESLRGLQSSLAEKLRKAGFILETRPFSPHVTLLRKAECADSGKENPAAEPVAWTVRDFVLVKSSVGANGSRYEQIGRWRLL